MHVPPAPASERAHDGPAVPGRGKRLFDGFHHDVELGGARVHSSLHATHVPCTIATATMQMMMPSTWTSSLVE